METVTKKVTTIEFQGKKYALNDESTVGDLLYMLGLPKDTEVRLESKDDGFALIAIIDNR